VGRFRFFAIGHGNDVESDTERMLVAVIDDVLRKYSSGGLIPSSELIDVLLDLRLAVGRLAAMEWVDSESTSEHSAPAATRWHWYKPRMSHPSRSR
jgi:hypothetical protein